MIASFNPLPAPASIPAAAANNKSGVPAQTAQKAKKSSQEFEAVFLGQILNTMSEGLQQDTGFDGGSAETQWRTLLNEYTARNIAQKGGVGLSDGIMREALRTQGA
jgi:Rod binding domain-containing protein